MEKKEETAEEEPKEDLLSALESENENLKIMMYVDVFYLFWLSLYCLINLITTLILNRR